MRSGPSRQHPLTEIAATFLTGALAGGLFLAGLAALSPDKAALFDLHGDGLDFKDAWAVMWLFGHVAILAHFVLPGLISD